MKSIAQMDLNIDDVVLIYAPNSDKDVTIAHILDIDYGGITFGLIASHLHDYITYSYKYRVIYDGTISYHNSALQMMQFYLLDKQETLEHTVIHKL